MTASGAEFLRIPLRCVFYSRGEREIDPPPQGGADDAQDTGDAQPCLPAEVLAEKRGDHRGQDAPGVSAGVENRSRHSPPAPSQLDSRDPERTFAGAER